MKLIAGVRKLPESTVNYRLWLEREGAVFEECLYNILLIVNSTNSLSQATRELSISYSLAWGKIRNAEKGWGLPLIITRVGGSMGGETSLTFQAKELLRKYQSVKYEFDRLNTEINKASL